MKAEDIKIIGLCGAGAMAAGITQVAAASGFELRAWVRTEKSRERSLGIVTKNLDRMVSKEKITAEDRDAILGRIHYSFEPDFLADADIIIEGIIEDAAIKKELFDRLETIVPKDVAFATNTSSISITQIAATTQRPDLVVGLHFMNPVPVMQLVEIIPALQTSPDTLQLAIDLTKRLGKTPVISKDSPGFIVNRLLIPMICDAARMLEGGVASAQDIDTAMKLGANLPMGPLELGDLIGIDVDVAIAETLYEYTREPRFYPPIIMQQMVKAGYLGRKTGRGFHDYSTK